MTRVPGTASCFAEVFTPQMVAGLKSRGLDRERRRNRNSDLPRRAASCSDSRKFNYFTVKMAGLLRYRSGREAKAFKFDECYWFPDGRHGTQTTGPKRLHGHIDVRSLPRMTARL